MMESIDLIVLKGSPHFMIGFVFGYLIFRILLTVLPDNLRIILYAPHDKIFKMYNRQSVAEQLRCIIILQKNKFTSVWMRAMNSVG